MDVLIDLNTAYLLALLPLIDDVRTYFRALILET